MDSQNIKNIPGPDTISTFTLKNGITVLNFSNFNSHSIYMIGILNGSGVWERFKKRKINFEKIDLVII